MNVETKFKWALTGFLVMVLLNVSLLATIWINRAGAHEGKNIRDNDRNPSIVNRYMQRELQLTAAQADSLSALRTSHFEDMRALRSELDERRRAYFDFIMSEEADNTQKRDSILTELTEQYSLIENMFYTHMAEIKGLLNSDQQEGFERLMRETFLRNRRGGNMKMPRRNR
jgi:Spy/CpxP family protein refolding chaperone